MVLTTPTLSVAAPVQTSGMGSATYPAARSSTVLLFHGRRRIAWYRAWKYDGTTATLAADIRQGSAGSTPLWLTVYNGALYFTADDGVHNRELWRYDGTTATLAADIGAGSNGSNPGWPTVYHGLLYFGAWDGLHFRRQRGPNSGASTARPPALSATASSPAPAAPALPSSRSRTTCSTSLRPHQPPARSSTRRTAPLVWLAADIQSGTFSSGVAELVALSRRCLLQGPGRRRRPRAAQVRWHLRLARRRHLSWTQ